MDYLEGNISLAMDILTLIDLVKLKLEFILKIDMITLDNKACYNENNDDDNDDYDNDTNGGPSMPTNYALLRGSRGPFESTSLNSLISKRQVQGMTRKGIRSLGEDVHKYIPPRTLC